MSSENQDRITLLSDRLVAAEDLEEIIALSVQLQKAIRDHVDNMREKLSATPDLENRNAEKLIQKIAEKRGRDPQH
jgi:hypothetical protein